MAVRQASSLSTWGFGLGGAWRWTGCHPAFRELGPAVRLGGLLWGTETCAGQRQQGQGSQGRGTGPGLQGGYVRTLASLHVEGLAEQE